MKVSRYSIWALLFLFSQVCNSQEPMGRMVEVGSELPDRQIRSIVQDSFHFMWLGSATGFHIYDGERAIPFRAENTVDQVAALQTANELLTFGNYIIARNNKNLQIIDTRDRSILFTSPDSLIVLEVFGNEKTKYFFFESETYETVIMQFSNEKLTSIPLNLQQGARLSSINCSEDGTFYYILRDGSLHRKKAGGRSEVIDSETYKGRRPFYIPKIITRGDRVYLMDSQPKRLRLMMLDDNNRIEELLIFPEKSSFIRENGKEMFFYNARSHELIIYAHPEDSVASKVDLPSEAMGVAYVYRDLNRNLWIAWTSRKEGHLSMTKRSDVSFRTLGQRNMRVRNMAELENGELGVTTQEGIYITENKRKILRPCSNFSHEQLQQNWWKMVVDTAGNRIFVSRTMEGIYEFDSDCVLKNHIMNDLPNMSNRSMGMTMDNNGLLWVGTISGLSWYHIQSDSFLPRQYFSPSFYNVPAYDWVQLNKNEFWLCSANGLFLFDSTRQIVNWYHTNSEPALSSNEVYDIVWADDRYYIATSNGINILHDQQVTQIGTDKGLPNEIVVSLLLDSLHLWAGTYNGLSRMHRTTSQIENFFDYDGLPDNEFNKLARLKSTDGYLHFGTQGGVVSFNPNEFETVSRQYPIVMTSFTRFDRNGQRIDENIPPFGQSEPIVLPAENKYFQIEVALMSYIDSDHNKYTYFLEGLEDDWRELSSSNIIQYNNLPPGKYLLRIRGVNASGSYSMNEIQLTLDVRQYFYKRWYFIVLMTGLILGVIGFFYWRRMRYRMNMERMRTRLSQDLHDEIGSALTGVSMQLQLLEFRASDKNRPAVARIAKSSKEIVSRLRDYLWAIDSRSDDWLSLKDQMIEFLHRQLDAIEMPYTFDVKVEEGRTKLAPDIKQNLYLIFKEAITNAMKHADASHILIKLRQTSDEFLLIVKDDGHGLISYESLNGQGLRNMESRAKAIGAEFRITDDQGVEVCVEKR